MGRLILNCDLGENEPLALTELLMQLVHAANIGCGVHAGSEAKVGLTLELAKRYGVLVGAHPGMASEGGRGADLPDASAFRELLQRQLGSFCEAAEAAGVSLHHVKLHGSLYMGVERDPALAEVYLEQLALLPGVKVFALSGGGFSTVAAKAGVTVLSELFADRAYASDGSLLPRSEPGALIQSVDVAVRRIRRWIATGEMELASGSSRILAGDTLCVHSDSAQALDLLRALRIEL